MSFLGVWLFRAQPDAPNKPPVGPGWDEWSAGDWGSEWKARVAAIGMPGATKDRYSTPHLLQSWELLLVLLP